MRRLRILAVVLPALAACKGSSDKTSGPVAPLGVTATILSGNVALPNGAEGVKADGAGTVQIAVSGAAGPITLLTSRGTFSNGQTSITVDATSPSAVLTTCDARNDPTCAGTRYVTAQTPNLATGSVPIRFVGFERTCANGLDDNGDGHVDCADTDCDTLACKTAAGEAGTCTSGACVASAPTGPSGPTGPTGPGQCSLSASTNICTNAACEGSLCVSGDTTHRCRSGVCVDTGTPWDLTVAVGRARLPANGMATTTITVKAIQGITASASTQVTLSTDLGEFLTASGASRSVMVTTGNDGTATATYRASAQAGTATINAAIGGTNPTTQSVLVTMPALGAIVLPAGGIQNPIMGVKYSGWNEQNHIVVALLDTDQKPYPDGLAVRFEHQRLGGSTVSAPLAPDTATCVAANNCIAYVGQTGSLGAAPDSGGLATVNLYSGTIAGLASLTVTAVAGGATRTLNLQGMAIVGAKASGAHVSIDCSPKNLPVLAFEHDCINSLLALYNTSPAAITCVARFADRFNNVLGTSLLTTFASEAGAAGPPVHTTAYDPQITGDQTSKLGFAVDTVAVSGYALPRDVPPIDGEPRTTIVGGDACTSPADKTRNPRDGLSTIIVMAKGEEGFIDLNGNGIWDAGEPFVDLGEPYVDENDNGIHDPGEYFVDLNGNGRYDGPNGVWDADTTIWTETRVLYTGVNDPALTSLSPTSIDVTYSSPSATFPVTFGFLDANHNPLAAAVTSYTPNDPQFTSLSRVSRPPNKVDRLGVGFTIKYCDQPAGSATPPTVCGSTCPSAPCFVVPVVSGFAVPDLGVEDVDVGFRSSRTVYITPAVNAPDDVAMSGVTVFGPPAAIPVNVR